MQYIDKNDATNIADFNRIVDPYLANGLYRYDDLNGSDRHAMRQILKGEQRCCCAYCMADLTSEEGTSDHIIPKTISEQNYNKARGLGKGIYRNDFIYGGRFTLQSVGTYYPHTLAYGNLVFTCDDCNTKKDQDLIIPVFFTHDSSAIITYTAKGLLKSNPSNAIPTNLKSWLNQEPFMLYRAMWRAAKLSGVTIETIEAAKTVNQRSLLIEQMKQMLTNVEQKNAADKSLNSKAGWQRFLQFKWFWSYYHEQTE